MSNTSTSKKWRTVAVLMIVLLAIALVVRVATVTGGGPNIRITISKETTYITEPLRPDGYPDYFAALNQRLSKGVTSENNSAVLFIKAVGPGCIPTEIRGRYFEMLGVPQPPAEGDYLIDTDNFIKHEQQAGRLPVPADGDDSKIRERFTTAQTRPWSEKEFPEVARWLKANEKPLAVLVEASKRSKRYDPYVSKGERDLLIGALLPTVQQSREVARILATRAMLRTHQGDIDGAWQDLLACHRFARLVGQGMCLVENLVAIALDGMAMAGERALLQQPNLTSKQIATMRADLAKLPPMPKMAKTIDLGERYMFLDAVSHMARYGLDELTGLIGTGPDTTSKKTIVQSLMNFAGRTFIDWDVSLRMINSWHDRLVEAARKPTRAEKLRASHEIEDSLKDMRASVTPLAWLTPSDAAGKLLISLMLPATSAACQAEDRWMMQRQVNETAFALAEYRAERGAYPEKLAELTPKYMAEIPKDMFNSNADLQYIRRSDGWLLHSFGPNGRDDGGKGVDDRKDTASSVDWDDIAVRLGTK